jgi:hypothetical protein
VIGALRRLSAAFGLLLALRSHANAICLQNRWRTYRASIGVR